MICKLANISDVEAGIWYEYSLQSDEGLISVMMIMQDDSQNKDQKNSQKSNYTAFKNLCPHQGRRMDYAAGQFLIAENGNIICPAHGAEFKAEDGLCINGPCRGQSLQPIHIQLNEESIFAIIK